MSRAFTSTGIAKLPVLTSECRVARSVHGDVFSKESFPVTAIWDTGASECSISQDVAKDMNLKPIGVTLNYTAAGAIQVRQYLVDLLLPNSVLVKHLVVTACPLVGLDFIIGMDVITRGDFAITGKDGKTKFSFRIPGNADIDFVRNKF